MRKLIGRLRYGIGNWFSQTGDRLINSPPGRNPIHSDWMGDEISWRLHGLADAVGEALNSETGSQEYQSISWDDAEKHDHCNACWAIIAVVSEGTGATQTFYSNEATTPVGATVLCPVCFSLFEAVCAGIIKIQVTDADALMPFQKKQDFWQNAVAKALNSKLSQNDDRENP